MPAGFSPGRIRFGDFEVDCCTGEVRRNGVLVPLQQQPFQLLLRLLHHPGELVTREALRQQLWPEGTFVDFEQGLNAAVKRLRAALGDSAETPRYIETLPKRGYRFIAPLVHLPRDAQPVQIQPQREPNVERAVELGKPVPRSRFTRFALPLAVIAFAASTFPISRGKGHASQAGATEPALVRLTYNTVDAAVTSSSISPDGRYLAFADPTGVQVRPIDGGEVHHLPDTRGMQVSGWTASSASVLVSRCDTRSCSGFAVSLIGNDRHRTGAEWGANDWVKVAPDGVRLLRRGYGDFALTVDPMNGSPDVELTRGRIFAANWSADGKRVLFVRDLSIIESVPAEGGTPKELFRAAGDQRIGDVIELPDRSIVLAMTPPGPGASEAELWRSRTDATGALIESPRRLTWGAEDAAHLSAALNGMRVAFQRVSFHADIYVADGDLRSGPISTPRRLTTDDATAEAFAWTPDSREVLFDSNRNGTSDIFKQRIDSSTAEPFLIAPGDQRWPEMTSDHRWVLYLEGPAFAANIMRLPLSGGAPDLVLRGGENSAAYCAAYGRCVVVETKDGADIISALDPVQGRGAELARIPGAVTGIDILPNGEGVAYVPAAGSNLPQRVRLVSFEGKPASEILVPHATRLLNPRWLASGLGFIASDNGQSLIAVSRSGSSRVLWSAASLFVTSGVPSPDEKHLAITVGSRQSNVWMITGF